MSVWSSEVDPGNSSTVAKGVLAHFAVAVNAGGHESSFYLHVYAGIGLLQCELIITFV